MFRKYSSKTNRKMEDCYTGVNIPIENDTASSDSETDGDDYDDDHYEEIRKNIKPILNLGQTLTALWPISLLEQRDSEDAFVNCDYIEGPSLSKSLDWPSGSMQNNLFEPKHRRAPSLPLQGKLEQIKLQLDEISLTPDEEYGFNPMRKRSLSKASGRRSVSLFVPDETANALLDLSNSRKLVSVVLSSSSLQDDRSLARNEEEAKIEEDIASLRAQPSNVEFNRKNRAKEHFEELISKRSSARKKWGTTRSLRRKLSFDSHPRCRTFSEGTTPLSDSEHEKNNIFKVLGEKKASQAEMLNPQNSDISFFGSEPCLNPRQNEIKLAPPPLLSSKTVVEVLVSNPAEKGKKRRSGIPQFLTALKLPNKKTIKKFMRKKSERHPDAASGGVHPKIPKPFPVERGDVDSERDILSANNIDRVGQTPRSPSVNTFARPSKEPGIEERKRKHLSNAAGPSGRHSCSMCSLQKVEEGKETSEFDGSLSRKSCSSCSIAIAKFCQSRNAERPVLERRLSDTALALKGERQTSCSPGRRFILRLLSPVVCGLNSDRYMNFQTSDSYSSLASYNSDVSVEADLLSQKLTDFDVVDIAEELALIDKELLIRITWQELATCGWMSINKYVTSPNVMNMVEFFNRVAMMVATSILMEETPYLRAKAITKMIKLASKCRHLKNYNSLRAVLGGLQCTPIYRLESSWKQVRGRRKRLFGELSNLMSEENNFSSYREELKHSLNDPPCMPFLGDFLTQIAQTQAYVALRRKRSLAKQRLEKASTTSCTEVFTSADLQKEAQNERFMNVDERKEKETDKETDLCLEKFDEDKSIKIEKDDEQIDFEKSSEKEEKNLDLTLNEKKEEKILTGNLLVDTGEDEVDKSGKNVEKKMQHFQSDLIPIEDSEKDGSTSHCEGSSSSEGDNEEDVKLDKLERETIRRSINGITKAMFQTGKAYYSSENDNEFLEALNEYLENQKESDIPVFIDVECSGVRASRSNPKTIDTKRSRPNNTACTCDDHGVGSASSSDLSPMRSSDTPFPSGKIGAEKKTHARNDSNDSGVVLQNGRSSRASEELNESRENLNVGISDPKVSKDADLVDTEATEDGNTLTIIPILERNGSESRSLEERIKKGKPSEEEAKYKKEFQFWEYQIAAMKYQLTQRMVLRKYLLNACYNSEEENYSLSLKREPIVKKH